MSSVPLHLLDNQTLVAALLRIQSMPTPAPSVKKQPEVPQYVNPGIMSFFTTSYANIDSGDEPRVSNYHELGKTIAAELWARGVLRLELPTVERVMRELDAALQEDR